MDTDRTTSAVTRSAVTRSASATRELGVELARLLKAGDVVALRGDLGAGKTCLIQGVCQGLKVEDVVNSPTFIIVNEYAGRIGTQDVRVFHFDLYRLTHPAELVDLGVEDYLDAGGVCFFEWAERGGEVLPVPRWEVELEYLGDEERRISWTYLESTGTAATRPRLASGEENASTQRRRA